jgi:transcriptional regulator with XRE-family HTH domain
MGLKEIFIVNLKKFRKREKISQMRLAEKCNTAASYIGEIEIGRKFPSLEMIERIAGALRVEPYRFFMDAPDQKTVNADNAEFFAYFENLPPDVRKKAINGIMDLIGDSLRGILKVEPEYAGEPQRTAQSGKGDRPENPRKRKS